MASAEVISMHPSHPLVGDEMSANPSTSIERHINNKRPPDIQWPGTQSPSKCNGSSSLPLAKKVSPTRSVSVTCKIIVTALLSILFSPSPSEQLIYFKRKRRRTSDCSPEFKIKVRRKLIRRREDIFSFIIPASVLLLIFFAIHQSKSTSTPLILAAQAAEPIQQTDFPSSAFFDEPQPLVYLPLVHDSGSGWGYPQSSPSSSLPPDSSSISPSLITAKCWNNYENDNECRHLNVITAPESDQRQHEDGDDDSIITPVVIFESSSTVEPSGQQQQQQPAHLAPPYFSSSARPDADNVLVAPVQNRHRTNPPTANDVYSAPPAGATILPGAEFTQSTTTYESNEVVAGSKNRHSWQRPSPLTTTTTTPKPPHLYVVTPQPARKGPKTTTLGRTCRDENDEDCDEPEDGGGGGGGGGGDDDDADDRHRGAGRSRSESRGGGGKRPFSSSTKSSTATGDGDDSDGVESGSGNGPSSSSGDDNEDGGDDGEDGDGDGGDGGNGALESSGNSEPTAGSSSSSTPAGDESASSTTRSFVDISSFRPPMQTDEEPEGRMQSTTARPEANIVVNIHSTLPPSFPITSTGRYPVFDPIDGSIKTAAAPTTSTTTTSTTMIPDDTYRSKPVFPSSSPQAPDASSDSNPDNSATTSEPPLDFGPVTTPGDGDLYTFKPIPILEGNEIRGGDQGIYSLEKNQQPQNNSDSSSGELASKHKFDPNAAAKSNLPPKFGNPWMHPIRQQPQQPANPVQLGESLGNSMMRKGSDDGKGNMARASSSRGESHQKMQSEILSTLLLYASILIVVTTAIIFVVMSIAYWRRSSERQRALLSKAHLLGGPGGGGGGRNGQLVGSMSQASQLMGNMQQPGLLATYAPDHRMNLGKVTTSIVKPTDDMIAEEGEEDSRLMNMDEDDRSKDQMADSIGSDTNGNNGNRSGTNNNISGRQATNASWSTEDPSSSSGSQRTNDSQRGGQVISSAGGGGQGNQRHLQYPNSLSDGQQHSSSISDSQESPDATVAMPPNANAFSPEHQQAYLSQQQQQQPGANYNGRQMPVDPEFNPHHRPGPPQPMIPYPGEEQPFDDIIQGNAGGAPPSMQASNGHVQLGPAYMGPPPHPIGPIHNQQGQFRSTGQLNGQPHGPVPSGGYPPVGPDMNGRYFDRQPGAPPMVDANSPAGPRPGIVDFQFNSSISPARVAMNPLATLGRRYQPGVGLNRTIYSEDSSSFITTSPSLARTSSSTSFAFSTSNQPVPLRGKPLVDSSGRMFADYTQTNFNGNGNGPPVLGRKDRSEAWYV